MRPEPSEYDPHFEPYLSLVPESEVLSAMAAQVRETEELLRSVDEARGGHRYAAGKWSIREIAGHLSDAERVFGYRSFSIARGEKESLPGFDENPYIAASGYDRWTMSDLIESFTALRTSNLLLFRMLDEDAWSNVGTANGHAVTPRALAYGMVGHERHHSNILRERYL
jgi:hypothetical protein